MLGVESNERVGAVVWRVGTVVASGCHNSPWFYLRCANESQGTCLEGKVDLAMEQFKQLQSTIEQYVKNDQDVKPTLSRQDDILESYVRENEDLDLVPFLVAMIIESSETRERGETWMRCETWRLIFHFVSLKDSEFLNSLKKISPQERCELFPSLMNEKLGLQPYEQTAKSIKELANASSLSNAIEAQELSCPKQLEKSTDYFMECIEKFIQKKFLPPLNEKCIVCNGLHDEPTTKTLLCGHFGHETCINQYYCGRDYEGPQLHDTICPAKICDCIKPVVWKKSDLAEEIAKENKRIADWCFLYRLGVAQVRVAGQDRELFLPRLRRWLRRWPFSRN